MWGIGIVCMVLLLIPLISVFGDEGMNGWFCNGNKPGLEKEEYESAIIQLVMVSHNWLMVFPDKSDEEKSQWINSGLEDNVGKKAACIVELYGMNANAVVKLDSELLSIFEKNYDELLVTAPSFVKYVLEPKYSLEHTDSDGIPYDYDVCPSENEVFNGYRDFDGCADETRNTVGSIDGSDYLFSYYISGGEVEKIYGLPDEKALIIKIKSDASYIPEGGSPYYIPPGEFEITLPKYLLGTSSDWWDYDDYEIFFDGDEKCLTPWGTSENCLADNVMYDINVHYRNLKTIFPIGKDVEIKIVGNQFNVKSPFELTSKITKESSEVFYYDEDETSNIPPWIKNNANWWGEGNIPDKEFVSGIEYLIKEEILLVPEVSTFSHSQSEGIPEWIRNNAIWWAEGLISDNDFLEGIKYMITEGIIFLSSVSNFEPLVPLPPIKVSATEFSEEKFALWSAINEDDYHEGAIKTSINSTNISPIVGKTYQYQIVLEIGENGPDHGQLRSIEDTFFVIVYDDTNLDINRNSFSAKLNSAEPVELTITKIATNFIPGVSLIYSTIGSMALEIASEILVNEFSNPEIPFSYSDDSNLRIITIEKPEKFTNFKKMEVGFEVTFREEGTHNILIFANAGGIYDLVQSENGNSITGTSVTFAPAYYSREIILERYVNAN